ncbi:tetratricopeptide repeat-containing sensor histidine kinase [Mucilaginibacter aquaedulcis]|uniref:tetratricopeptide repeat-containing sensor histidine kinase n=1 Tax=Mucilaginibacter aquaedulcis TaxID=1187081 RepID=UPI0025B5DF40|nr:sensor histidine kinase [Mucilaginibacter aquaedulcis]MDN3548863.1 sensor histidine kinase [Mucilaginibacter aquaedulcis]
MKRKRWHFCMVMLLLGLFSETSEAQVRISDKPHDVLLLQLSSGFLYVVKQARVDLDSTLMITSQRHGLSRIPIITEGFDKNYPLANCKWMDDNDTHQIITRLDLAEGKEHARLLLLLGAYYAFYPGTSNVNIERAVTYLNGAKKECSALGINDWATQCDILLGKCYFKSGKVDAAKAIIQHAVESAKRYGNQDLIAKAYYYVGAYCPFIPELLDYRIACLEKAERLYRILQDHVNQTNVLMDLSYQNFARGKVKESEAAAVASLNLQKSINFPYTHYTNDMLAYLARITANFANELQIGLYEAKTAEVTRDSLGLGYFYLRVGEAYYNAGNHVEESNAWYRKALTEFVRNGGDPALYVIFSSDMFIEYGLNDHRTVLKTLQKLLKDFPPTNTIDQQSAYVAIAACYEKLNRYKDAEKYLLMAEKLEQANRKIRGNLNDNYIYFRLGGLYTELKDQKKSKFYNQKFISTSKDTILLLGAYRNLYQADSASGGFTAMRNLYHYAVLKDKIYTKAKNKLVEELSVRYQTSQKEKDIEVYKARNLLQSQTAATTRRITIAGLIVLMLIILLIWLLYVGKQRSNRQLQSQKDEIARKNLQLEHVIDEKDELLVAKEWLLKEVHHRVKNNLQLVMSLLNSQSTYLKDETALNAVLESRHRVQAMSLIHQKLYKSDNASSINMRDYIKELVAYLKESFKTGLSIYFELRIDALELDVSQAVPVGLILNELITNAIKYAFPYTGEDRIVVVLSKTKSNVISLVFSDNGRGLPVNFDESETKSFGIKLIKGLAEDLGGILRVESLNGTMVTMQFKIADFYEQPELLNNDHS